MRRKSVKAAGSPDKAAPAPATRRTTRRAKKSPEPEIPKEFLAQSDNSDPSDNDSDYGTPTKKRGGRKLSRATPKKSEEKAPARGRGRGRKAQKELTPEPIAEEEDTENGDNDPPASADHEPASEENEVSVINEQEDAQINNEPVQEELAPEVELVGRSESPEIQAVDSPVAQVQEEEEIQESVDVTVVEDSESEEQEKSVENPEESESETEIVPNIIPEPIQQVPVQSSERSQKIRSRSSSSASSEEVSKSPQQVDSDSKDSSVLSVKETEPMDVDSSMEILNKPKASKAQQIEEVKQKEPEKPSRWNKKPPVVEVQEILEVPEVVEPEQPIPDIKEQEIVEERVANTIQRKRRWKCRQDSETIVAITTDSLKNIISDVEVVPLADVKLDSSPEREIVEEVEKVERRSERPERTKPDDKETKLLQMQRLKDRLRKQEEEEERRLQQNAKNLESIEVTSSAGAALSLNRKVSIVVDDQAPPSPPTQSCSNILFISNLVRPFTVLQLKGLLARTGKIVENGFWIDKIKSKCYVKYESDE